MTLKCLISFIALDIKKLFNKPVFILAPGAFFGLFMAIYQFLSHQSPSLAILWILVFLSLGVHQAFSLNLIPLDFIKLRNPQAGLYIVMLRLLIVASIQSLIFYGLFYLSGATGFLYPLIAFVFSGLGLQLFCEGLTRGGTQSVFISYIVLMPLYLPLLIFVLKVQDNPTPLAALTVFILVCAFSFFNVMVKRS